MQMGMIGLGRMGGNMARRLLKAGHTVVGYDSFGDAVGKFEADGGVGARTLDELVEKLTDRPRVIWVMVPAGDITAHTIRDVINVADKDDIVIDGGNTNWKLALNDAHAVKEAGLHYLDAGTSGGIWGLENGYSLMVGGPDAAYEHCLPLLRDLAPPEGGLVHTGPEGSGHYVKMVHNGVEYGLMQSYAEGFEIMKHSPHYPEMDLAAIADAWRFGSVVRSWLLDLIADGLHKDPDLDGLKGYVEDTGEGRWTVEAALEEAVPATVITHALYARFRSRMENTYADKMLAMMRNQFGGHAIKKE